MGKQYIWLLEVKKSFIVIWLHSFCLFYIHFFKISFKTITSDPNIASNQKHFTKSMSQNPKNINTADTFVSERIGTDVALQSILSPFSQFRRNHISHHFRAGTGRHPTHADTPPDPPPQTWAPGAGLRVFNFKYKAI